jgi:subtilisin family serine protease
MKMIVVVLCLCSFLSQAQQKYWIYFADKGELSSQQGVIAKNSAMYKSVMSLVTPKALERRAKVISSDRLVTESDLPLYQPYVEQVQELGGIPAHGIRWMNAMSFYLTAQQLAVVNNLPFVKKVTPVVILHAKKEEEVPAEAIASYQKVSSLDYGLSLLQSQMINVPQLHDLGINGKGVLIGMLDTGFRWRMHEALKTRDIIAEHDFIFNDDTTANQAGDSPSQDSHGTLVLSIIGGYMPGQLIGPAYKSTYILGKTEYFPTETQIEEDNWAAGIEWMENQGVDLVSSSVGYDIFDDHTGYTWANGDFDGRTSVTALAALNAARLGVVVCNAMGNNGNGSGVTATMLTPADADSIISVGAVSFSGDLAGFSSTGPTNDGRFKPDVVAPGVGVRFASTNGPSSYGSTIGTSLATPLAAGAAALLLSVRPELTPIQVRDAIRSTADSVDIISYPEIPNNFTGWGLVDALDAALSFGPIFSNEPTIDTNLSMSVVSTSVTSKFGVNPSTVKLYYAVGSNLTFTPLVMSQVSSMLFPTSGIYSATIPLQPHGTTIHFYIEAQDSGLHTYQSPAPVKNTTWQLQYGLTDLGIDPTVPASFELLQNYPNPFNPETNIEIRIANREFVSLKIFDVLGREIETLLNEVTSPGVYKFSWNASRQPSGVYFYRLAASSSVSTRKMILLR